jgi:hypothetical protein
VPALLFVRIAVSIAVAMISYHLLELPIRERRWHLPKSLPKSLTRPRVTAPIGIAALVGVLVAATPAPAPVAAAPVAGPPVNTNVGSPAPPGASRVLFVGDSMAVSLADALARSEVPYHVHIDNAGLLGCGIALGSPRRFRGTESDDPSFCKNWPQLRGDALAKDKPDLAVALVGEWELMDRKRDGKWVHIGQPAYDAYLAHQLDLLIQVMSAGGTHVALLTTPCRRFDESANGSPWPESSPARLDRFNELLRAAVARHPDVASVVDFKSMVCPGGKYVSKLGGVAIRNADGIHFPEAAIPPVAEQLLPVLRKLATR